VKILVADDDSISRRILQQILQAEGYEVVAVENGRRAMEEFTKEDGPRLALIDWMMPELDGPSVCREMRARNEGAYVYIVLLTSRQSNEDTVLGLESGADDYLTKPCSAAELTARLRTGRRILKLEDRLVEAREEMRFKATHDSLTRLWNRGAILSLLKAEVNRAIRSDWALSIVLADIDHFKRINDLQGHAAGDTVLQQVAERLLRSVRQYDVVGRYGGEEFLMVLSDCDATEIRVSAERLRAAVANEPFVIQGQKLQVTMSFGAITIESWNMNQPIEWLLNRADAALYRAKALGRNRAEFVEEMLPA
jgi:diguanylate cyclase (GGDEF)-like protein